MKRTILLSLLLGSILTQLKAEECWYSSKDNDPGPNGYNTVTYTSQEIGGDTRHDLVCSGQDNKSCVWPNSAGYNGPPPIFVPANQTFTDEQGNPLSLTGAQLNQLIWDQYNAGNLSGTIVIGAGAATFTFKLASDLHFTEVKHL